MTRYKLEKELEHLVHVSCAQWLQRHRGVAGNMQSHSRVPQAACVALVLHVAAACQPSGCLHERQLGCRDKKGLRENSIGGNAKDWARQTNWWGQENVLRQGMGEDHALEWQEARSSLVCLRSFREDATGHLPGMPPPMLAEAVSLFPYTSPVCSHPSFVFLAFLFHKTRIAFCTVYITPSMWGSQAGSDRCYYK